MRILLVDDHDAVRQSLAAFIDQLGHQSIQVDGAVAAIEAARKERPDLIVSDLRMPGMDGLQLLNALEELDDPPPLALMTAFGDADTAITAMRLGAVDYLRKPIDVRELHRLIERFDAAASVDVAAVDKQPREEADGVVVHGAAFAKVITLCDRLHTASDLPCLIEGETGCGKELVARRIHHGGKPDTGRPFIALNCAAIAPGLFEAELFGYAAGSFTGALAHGAPGKLALAAGGTILLDEVADLPLDQQAKLLRVLEDRTWYAVGSSSLQRLTARVIGACNIDLVERVRAGRFREDLYYRLKVGHVRIPPLRERREDIMPMTQIFLNRIRKQRGRGFQKCSTAAAELLTSYTWPGNIRQLKHVLEQASLLFDGAVLDAPLLSELLGADSLTNTTAPDTLSPPSSPQAATLFPQSPSAIDLPGEGFDLDTWQRAVIAAALAKNGNAPVKTAQYLGISRKVLYTLRKRYGLLDTNSDSD